MKTTLKIFILLFTCNMFAQNAQIDNPRLAPFIGTWTAQYDQNKVFTLTLWIEDHNIIRGNYKIEKLNNNGNVIKSYKSNYSNSNFPNNEWPPVIYYGKASQNNQISGLINDNTVYVAQDPNNRKGKQGEFSLTIQNPSNSNTAAWTVEETPGLKLEGYPDHFSIPTDITLTKVE